MGVQDNAWDDTGVRKETNVVITKNKFWLNELYNVASAAKISLPLGWNSQDFKFFLEGRRNKELTEQIGEHNSLDYCPILLKKSCNPGGFCAGLNSTLQTNRLDDFIYLDDVPYNLEQAQTFIEA